MTLKNLCRPLLHFSRVLKIAYLPLKRQSLFIAESWVSHSTSSYYQPVWYIDKKRARAFYEPGRTHKIPEKVNKTLYHTLRVSIFYIVKWCKKRVIIPTTSFSVTLWLDITFNILPARASTLQPVPPLTDAKPNIVWFHVFCVFLTLMWVMCIFSRVAQRECVTISL